MNSNTSSSTSPPDWDNALKLQAQATDQLVKIQLLQNLFQALNTTTTNGLLIGSRNLSPSLIGYANQNPPGFATCVDPSESRATHDHLNMWECVKGSDGGDGGFGADSQRSKGIWTNSDVKEGNHQYDQNTVNPLPDLVNSEPLPETNSTISGQMDNKSTTSIEPSSSIFEAWDKLMDNDDQASESYWKDILE